MRLLLLLLLRLLLLLLLLLLLIVCKDLTERAHRSCVTVIAEARKQCFGVTEALGTVYKHARNILDSINPDRWLTKQQLLSKRQKYNEMVAQQEFLATNLALKKAHISRALKRQIDERSYLKNFLPSLPALPSSSSSSSSSSFSSSLSSSSSSSSSPSYSFNGNTETDKDVCKPLNEQKICQPLSDTVSICSPSSWADEALKEVAESTAKVVATLKFEKIKTEKQGLEFGGGGERNYVDGGDVVNGDYDAYGTAGNIKFAGIGDSDSIHGVEGGVRYKIITPQRSKIDLRNSNNINANASISRADTQLETSNKINHNVTNFKSWSYILAIFSHIYSQLLALPLASLILLVAARRHVITFLTNDIQGNIIVDSSLVAYDLYSTNRFAGKKSIFPLKNFEKKLLVDRTEWTLSRIERNHLLVGCEMVLVSLVMSLALVIINKSLAESAGTSHLVCWSADEESKNFLKSKKEVGAIKSVDGHEAVVEMLQILLNIARLDSNKTSVENIDSAFSGVCNFQIGNVPLLTILLIVLLNVLMMMSVVLNVPITRMKDSIMSYYYPAVKMRRITSLHDNLLRNRPEQLNFIKKSVDRKVEKINQKKLFFPQSGKNDRKCNVMTKPLERRLRTLLSLNVCFSCKETVKEVFNCPQGTCDAIFCALCFEDFSSNCPHCVRMDKSNLTFCANVERRATGDVFSQSLAKCATGYYGTMSEEAYL
ncbi:hypothetical protein HELRODRAFT_175341 [Helobdella robusta]|uniref:Dendritic cell-specific transmembrane protein-like domain-containing protein n=1 Tax=Helobdella robusta TaxID=6412 RepID=T1F962_HELRO|nr:hypothetical protein HELRODRAFT_175341 [Helobdella robusta]ESO00848.1 hypothetical protein HELRODRAFT_175341 [Helobdella robusta]